MDQEKTALKCDYCGLVKDDVEVSVDPFDAEIYNDFTPVNICDFCAREREMEI